MELLVDRMASPIGTIAIFVNEDKLCALDFVDCEQRTIALLQKRYGNFYFKEASDPLGVSSSLRSYLQGDRHSLDRIPIDPGGTAFQQQVWSALRLIPLGTVLSYGELAAKIGKPNASRAVGMANSLNPIAIVLPCHRVIGAGSKLTGYAGGIERKRWLLQHEGVDGFATA